MDDERTLYSGRIAEIWTENPPRGGVFLELAMGPRPAGAPGTRIFQAKEDSLFSAFKRGDLVELSIALGSRQTVESIRSLMPRSPQGGSAAPRESRLSSPPLLSDAWRWRKQLVCEGRQTTRMALLGERQEILIALRDDLYRQGFLEVETPLLAVGTCPDTHIDSIPAGAGAGAGAIEGYLVTSTEYQLKRLLVGGFEQIYSLTKNFRAHDRGRYHSSEFTMLEWARAYGSLSQIEEDAVRFIRAAWSRLKALENQPSRDLKWNGQTIDLLGEPWERLTVREAFRRYLGLKDVCDFSLDALCEACQKAKVLLPENFTHDPHLVLSYLLDQVQPHLGQKTPTFLRDWPAFMTSSAQLSEVDPFVAERSELYIAGIEIADGFPFLREAEVQEALFNRELNRRKEEGKVLVSLDDSYLQSLAEGIPPGAGMALGVDRLVMVLTGATQLSDVQAFSWQELGGPIV